MQIKEFLETENFEQIQAGLTALKYACKRFEFEFDSGRDPLNEIVDNIFPLIEALYGKIETDYSIQAA